MNDYFSQTPGSTPPGQRQPQPPPWAQQQAPAPPQQWVPQQVPPQPPPWAQQVQPQTHQWGQQVQSQPQQWGTPSWQGQPPSSGSWLARTAIAVAVGVGLVVVLGVLAAIAIPVLLNQRAKGVAERTTVTMPAQVGGLSPLTDSASLAYVDLMQGMPGPGKPVAGAFGDARTQVYVAAAAHYMSRGDQRGFLDAAAGSAERQAGLSGLVWADAPVDALGGRMSCASSQAAAVTMCFFADSGAHGFVVVRGDASPAAVTLARDTRAAVVHRRT